MSTYLTEKAWIKKLNEEVPKSRDLDRSAINNYELY